MSLQFTKITGGPATCAARTNTRIAVGFASGHLRIFSAEDHFLERELHLGKAVTDVVAVPRTELVAVICDQKCAVHNLETRKHVANIDTRSARFVVGLPALQPGSDGAIAVGSSYKIRIVGLSGSRVTKIVVLDSPGRQHVRALGVSYANEHASGTREPPTVFAILGSKQNRIWQLNLSTNQLSPLFALDPSIFNGSAHKYVLATTENHIFVGSSVGSQLLRVSPLQIVKSWAGSPVQGVTRLVSSPLGVPLFAVNFVRQGSDEARHELSVVNPATGSALSNYTSVRLCGNNSAFAIKESSVHMLNCELTLERIAELEDKHEAATIALHLPSEYVTEQMRELERIEGMRVFENGEVDEAMRLFTLIEEQEQELPPEQFSNHHHVLRLLQSYLNELVQKEEVADADSSRTPELDRVSSSQESTFTAKTGGKVKRYHPLDSVVAYLVYTRRKLRLAGYTDESASEVDTALFQTYMLMKSPLVVPLLRSPNQCNDEVVKRALLGRGKWRELVWFLRSRGGVPHHKEALDILLEHDEPPESIASYLEQIPLSSPDELDLALTYSKPLLGKNTELAYRLFFENRNLDSWQVSEFLASISDDLVEKFVMFRVFELRDESPDLHNRAALLLAQNSDGSPENEAKMLDFLNISQFIDLEKLAIDSRIPARGRAWLHRRLGNYELAIDLCIDESADIVSAQMIAEQHDRSTYLFERLVESSSDATLQEFLNTVSVNSDIQLTHVLEKLPDDCGIENVNVFLEKFTAAQLGRGRNSEINAAVNRQALTEYSIELSNIRRQKFVVDTSSICSVCHKRLGRAVTGVVNGELVHYVCLKLL